MADSNVSKRVVAVRIDVTVDSSGNVGVNCTPNEVDVTERNSLISFTLATSGYRFRTSKAIELDVLPNPDFPFNSWTMSETLATLYDINNNDDDFDYTVTVVNTTTGKEYSVDPLIRNGGGSADDCGND